MQVFHWNCNFYTVRKVCFLAKQKIALLRLFSAASWSRVFLHWNCKTKQCKTERMFWELGWRWAGTDNSIFLDARRPWGCPGKENKAFKHCTAKQNDQKHFFFFLNFGVSGSSSGSRASGSRGCTRRARRWCSAASRTHATCICAKTCKIGLETCTP